MNKAQLLAIRAAITNHTDDMRRHEMCLERGSNTPGLDKEYIEYHKQQIALLKEGLDEQTL